MGHRSEGFEAIGFPKPKKDAQSVELYMAGPQYFETIGIPLLRGRGIGEESPAGPKVAVVNQEFVREVFGHADPIGHQVRSGETTYQVIGLARDTKVRTIGEMQRPALFRSIGQTIEKDPSMMGYRFMVRYEGDAVALAGAVRREIHAQDSSLAIFDAQTMEEHVHDALFLPRLVSMLFGVFGLTGLMLATVGLYSVLSYSVIQRTKEIGIRMAMGARAETVQKLIVLDGVKLAALSTVLGLPLSLAALRLSTSILYGVRPYDLETFIVVPLLLLAVALAACWIPSRRASHVDPIVALRVD